MKYDIKINKLPKSEVELEVSLPAEELDKARPKAVKRLSETVTVDGFRKGNVPEKIILEKVGEKAVLEEAAEIVLGDHYPKILEEAKIDTLGRPAVSITKLAQGNPIEFKVRTAVLPEFELPDYKKISSHFAKASRDKEIEVEDKEVEDVLLQIRKNKAHIDWHRANPEHKEHDPARTADAVQSGGHPDLEKEEALPALDDEFAKAAGNFQNVEGLRAKVKENIVTEKQMKETEKRRGEIMEALLKATEIELPTILVLSETEKSLAQMKDDITRMGGKWEDYLASTKKSEEDLKKDLQENSEKKAKIQLIFNKIAEAEKLEPNKEILENEVSQIMEHYKDASETSARIYVATMLLNQEVLKLLEA